MFTPTKRDALVIAGTIAVLTVGIATTAACTPDKTPAPAAHTAPATVAHPNVTLAPCAHEDSTNCYWDAASMGNGQGVSFINWAGVYYYAEGK